jgi:DNA-binding winged helix-turn-helix (wHTH) protein
LYIDVGRLVKCQSGPIQRDATGHLSLLVAETVIAKALASGHALPIVIEPQVTPGGEPAISFGPFRLVATRRLLLEGHKPVRLGSRAFDILTALVERAGEVVSKEELIARAWPTTFVEEANLTIQVSALRGALADGQGGNRYVATVVGRGYNFVAPICKEEPSRASPSQTIAPSAPHNLPFATTRMIGREEIVTALVTQLSHLRLVTVAGPGGIGKTTVSLAVAERMIGAYEYGVWLVDLAPLRDPGLVPSAVATVLGVEFRTEDPLPGLVACWVCERKQTAQYAKEDVMTCPAAITRRYATREQVREYLASRRFRRTLEGWRNGRWIGRVRRDDGGFWVDVWLPAGVGLLTGDKVS